MQGIDTESSTSIPLPPEVTNPPASSTPSSSKPPRTPERPTAAGSTGGGNAESAGGEGGQQAWDELQDALRLLEQGVLACNKWGFKHLVSASSHHHKP